MLSSRDQDRASCAWLEPLLSASLPHTLGSHFGIAPLGEEALRATVESSEWEAVGNPTEAGQSQGVEAAA